MKPHIFNRIRLILRRFSVTTYFSFFAFSSPLPIASFCMVRSKIIYGYYITFACSGIHEHAWKFGLPRNVAVREREREVHCMVNLKVHINDKMKHKINGRWIRIIPYRCLLRC